MDEDEGYHLPEDVSLRMAAMDFALRFSPDDVIKRAEEIYQFLKTGKVPEKDHDDAELQ